MACSELIERLTLLIVKSPRNRRKEGLTLVAKFHPVISGTILGKRFLTVFHENAPINGTGNVIETALPVRPSEPKRHAVYGGPHERPLRAAMAFLGRPTQARSSAGAMETANATPPRCGGDEGAPARPCQSAVALAVIKRERAATNPAMIVLEEELWKNKNE